MKELKFKIEVEKEGLQELNEMLNKAINFKERKNLTLRIQKQQMYIEGLEDALAIMKEFK